MDELWGIAVTSRRTFSRGLGSWKVMSNFVMNSFIHQGQRPGLFLPASSGNAFAHDHQGRGGGGKEREKGRYMDREAVPLHICNHCTAIPRPPISSHRPQRMCEMRLLHVASPPWSCKPLRAFFFFLFQSLIMYIALDPPLTAGATSWTRFFRGSIIH